MSAERPSGTTIAGEPADGVGRLAPRDPLEVSPNPDETVRRSGGRTHASAPLRALRSVWRLWFLVALVALWWVLSADSTSAYFPPLSDIVHRLWDLWVVGDAKHQLTPTLQHFVAGYAIAGVVGVLGGALLWRFRRVGAAVTPLLYFIYVIPAAALLPAIVAVLGFGTAMKVTIIALAAVWPTLLNTLDGARSVDPIKLDTALVLHMSKRRTILSVVLPSALPQIMAGLRSSLQVAIIMMVVSELIASTSGIGFFILDAQQRFAITDVWTGIIVLAVVGNLLTVLFIGIERIVLRSYIGARAVEGK